MEKIIIHNESKLFKAEVLDKLAELFEGFDFPTNECITTWDNGLVCHTKRLKSGTLSMHIWNEDKSFDTNE